MNDMPYSNREIDAHFVEIKESLARIEAQTTRTNGRVTGLETWKAKSTGYTTAAGVFIMVIISLVTYIFKSEIGTINAKEADTQALILKAISK